MSCADGRSKRRECENRSKAKGKPMLWASSGLAGGSLGALLGRLGGLLGRLEAILGASEAVMEASWPMLVASEACLGRFGSHFGHFGRFGKVPESCLAVQEAAERGGGADACMRRGAGAPYQVEDERNPARQHLALYHASTCQGTRWRLYLRSRPERARGARQRGTGKATMWERRERRDRHGDEGGQSDGENHGQARAPDRVR